MSDIKFASAGESVIVWNKYFTQVEELKNFNSGFLSICWSANSLYLAQLSSSQENIYLYSLNKENPTMILTGDETKLRTCICMDSSSHYVMAGGSDGMIQVWDSRNSKIRKTYQAPHTSITTVAYNHDDSVVAAGDSEGQLMLFNASSAVLSTPKRPHFYKSAMKQLKFSYYKNSLLSSVSDDGGTHLWDITSKKHLFEFKSAHLSPSTALTFSPINHSLMLTAGLDKRIVCYDVLSKKILNCVSVEEPLTSMDIMQDGMTVLAGTSRGKVLVYDLRKSKSPVNSIVAHNSPVYCLCVQRKPLSTTKNVDKSGIKNSIVVPSHTQQPQALRDANKTDNITPASPCNSVVPKAVTISHTLFSPCQDDAANDQPRSGSINCTFASLNNTTPHLSKDNVITYNRLSDASIFSPFSTSRSHHNSPISNHTDNFDNMDESNRFSMYATRNVPIGADDTSPLNFTTYNNQIDCEKKLGFENDMSSYNDHPNIELMNKTSSKETFDISAHVLANISNNIKNSTNKINNKDSKIDNYANNINKNNIKININADNINNNNSQPSCTNKLRNLVGQGDNTVGASAWKGGSIELFRSVVKEEVEEALEPLQSAIVNMHYEMVSKFHLLQVEIQKKSQEQLKMHEQILEANNKLCEENDQLKFRLEYLS